jgi:hypothetical protein
MATLVRLKIRLLTLLIFSFVFSNFAAAGTPCKYGQTGVLDLVGWKIERIGDQLKINLTVKNVYGKKVSKAAISLNIEKNDRSGIGLIGLVNNTPLNPGDQTVIESTTKFKNKEASNNYEGQKPRLCVSVVVDGFGEVRTLDGTEGF